MRLLTSQQVRNRLRHIVAAARGQSVAAHALGVASSLVNRALNAEGDDELPPKLLKGLGLRRVVRYEEIP